MKAEIFRRKHDQKIHLFCSFKSNHFLFRIVKKKEKLTYVSEPDEGVLTAPPTLPPRRMDDAAWVHFLSHLYSSYVLGLFLVDFPDMWPHRFNVWERSRGNQTLRTAIALHKTRPYTPLMPCLVSLLGDASVGCQIMPTPASSYRSSLWSTHSSCRLPSRSSAPGNLLLSQAFHTCHLLCRTDLLALPLV